MTNEPCAPDQADLNDLPEFFDEFDATQVVRCRRKDLQRLRESRAGPPWLQVGVRRRGYLSDAWSFFRQAFGDFEVEGPLSDAMEAFMKSMERVPSCEDGDASDARCGQ
jgi:hypothetical protein